MGETTGRDATSGGSTLAGAPLVLAVLALCLVQLIDVLGVTVVISTLPRMLADVGAPAAAGALVATGYAMTFGGLLMFGARFGDRLGHRRTILISLALFALGATTGVLANSLLLLTLARCLEGAAAALAVPSALRLLTGLAQSEAARARALAGWSAAGAVAGAGGFVIGGAVGALASWRWIFGGMLGVAVLVAVLIVVSIPRVPTGTPGLRLNLLSSLLLTVSVMAVVLATTVLPEPGRWLIGSALLIFAVGCATALALTDRRSAAPLLPGDVLRTPNLRRGAVANLLNTATTSSVATLITLFLQDARGYGPFVAALTLLPFSLAVILAASLAPVLMSRLRREAVVACGLLLIGAGVLLVIIGADLSVGAGPVDGRLIIIGAAMALAGLGIGVSSVAATSLGTDVNERARATASGVINTAAQLGTAVGTATVLLIATLSTGPAVPDGPAPWVGWGVAAVVALAGSVGFARLARLGRRRSADAG